MATGCTVYNKYIICTYDFFVIAEHVHLRDRYTLAFYVNVHSVIDSIIEFQCVFGMPLVLRHLVILVSLSLFVQI